MHYTVIYWKNCILLDPCSSYFCCARVNCILFKILNKSWYNSLYPKGIVFWYSVIYHKISVSVVNQDLLILYFLYYYYYVFSNESLYKSSKFSQFALLYLYIRHNFLHLISGRSLWEISLWSLGKAQLFGRFFIVFDSTLLDTY